MGKETPLKAATDADYELMLDQLNMLLDKWYKLGLRISVTTTAIPSLSAVIPVSDYALEAIQYNLAKDNWGLFNLSEPVSQSVKEMAKSSKGEVWAIAGPKPHTVFPGTLPMGSGNEGYRNNRKFYPDCDQNLYACDTDGITTESGIPLKGVDNG